MKAKNGHRFEEGKPNFWYHIALGSDFDGGIDPLNNVKTVSQYPSLRTTLRHEFSGAGQNWNLAKYNIDPENVDRIHYPLGTTSIQPHLTRIIQKDMIKAGIGVSDIF